MEDTENIKNSEVELDTDGVKEQKLQVEEQQVEVSETELPKQEVDLGYTEPKPEGIEGIKVETIKEEIKPEIKEDSLSDVSEKVKRRIDKLTFKIRESERREKAALDYAKGLKNQLDDTKTRFSKTSKSYIEQFSARVVAEQEDAKKALRDAIADQDADKIADANSRIATLAVEAEKVKMTQADEDAKEERAKTEAKTEANISKGKTFTAYHRTTAEPFSKFNETHRGERKSKHSYAGTEGIYFSLKSNDESTNAFGANEAEVELTINNPVPIKTFTSSFDKKKTTRAVIDITTEQDMPGMHTNDVYFEQDGELRAYDFEKKPKQKQLLKEGKLFVAFDPERIYLEPRSSMKKAGYDGIIVPEGLDIPAQIVILEPEQAKIKSFTHLPTKEDITPAKIGRAHV